MRRPAPSPTGNVSTQAPPLSSFARAGAGLPFSCATDTPKWKLTLSKVASRCGLERGARWCSLTPGSDPRSPPMAPHGGLGTGSERPVQARPPAPRSFLCRALGLSPRVYAAAAVTTDSEAKAEDQKLPSYVPEPHLPESGWDRLRQLFFKE